MCTILYLYSIVHCCNLERVVCGRRYTVVRRLSAQLTDYILIPCTMRESRPSTALGRASTVSSLAYRLLKVSWSLQQKGTIHKVLNAQIDTFSPLSPQVFLTNLELYVNYLKILLYSTYNLRSIQWVPNLLFQEIIHNLLALCGSVAKASVCVPRF